MKNYYEILEVDKNASKEVIEKAYKTLVKKYHPDLQQGETKKQYEEKMKQINNAYALLSDDIKREEYDNQLKQESETDENYAQIMQENIELKRKIQNEQKNKQYGYNQQYDEQVNQAVKQAYYDAYINDMKNRGYKIKYKKTLKDYCKSLIALVITLLIFLIILQIPVVKNYFISIYEENTGIKIIVDTFIEIFKQ